MPRIRCRYIDCIFLDDGYCSAVTVEIDPDLGCMTFKRSSDLDEDDWEEDNDEIDEWDGMEIEDEDDDLWLMKMISDH
jgi:hypothetical protein